jgi:small-conductance mechanosensitive channel
MDFLYETYYGNTVRAYLIAGGLVVGALIGARLGRAILSRSLGRLAAHTKTRKDDLAVQALENTKPLAVLIIALYAGSLALRLPPRIQWLLPMLAVAALMIQVGIWVSTFIRLSLEDYRQARLESGDTSSLGTVGLMTMLARLALWVTILLLILDNLGINVTALVASLGIGGIAIALAVQRILGDLLASISITLDRPFEVGDVIHVGDMIGRVEHIGIKTTRVRATSGEQLLFGNTDLLTSRIRNYKRMVERRVIFTIGVTYQTPPNVVERIPSMIREAVEVHGDLVRFDRAHFKTFGDSALQFEVSFFVLSAQMAAALDVQQAVNLFLMRRFADEGIEFAYPTQTLHLHKQAAAV